MFITFLLGLVFAVKVIALFCFPLLPVLLKVTSIDPDSPGAIGSLDQFGTVEPQEPLAFEIINGESLKKDEISLIDFLGEIRPNNILNMQPKTLPDNLEIKSGY